MKTLFRPILASALVLVLAGCAGTRQQQSTGEYIDSKTLNARVKAALIDDPVVRAMDVDVDVWRSTVQLNGFVNNEEQKRRAEEIARGVAGVRGVQNNLVVKAQAEAPEAVGTPATPPAVGQAQETREVEIKEINQQPARYFGQSVQLTGTVERIVDDQSFVLSPATGQEENLLILTHREEMEDIQEGDQVQLEGTVMQFEPQRFEQELGTELDQEQFAEWEGKPALIAPSVNKR